MPVRLLTYLAIIAAGYWYWSGPYQDKGLSSYETQLQENTDNMMLCIRGKNYKAGATGFGDGSPEEMCAKRYNLYTHDGQWYSYDAARKDD